eukprot:403463_1
MSAEELKIKGNSFFKQQNYIKALEYYSEAIKLDPENAIFYCNRAASYCAIDINKYYINAIHDSECAIKLDPQYAKAYSRLAWICHKKGQLAKALINYQRAINCLSEDNSSKLKQYEKQLQLCQLALQHQIQDIERFHSHIAKQILEPDKMKQKYSDYFILKSFGVNQDNIPPYSGDKLKGEKPLSFNDILTQISMTFRMLCESPQAAVMGLDHILNANIENKENNMHLDMNEIGQSIDDIIQRGKMDKDDYKQSPKKSEVQLDHTFKHEKIKELQDQKGQMEKLLLNTDQNNLHMRGVWGLMVWKCDRAINKFKQGIENNEPDSDLETWDDCDLNEESDIYGYPDCMAKKLQFEYGMMPWDDN